MRTWRIELEIQTEDAVTTAEMQEVADKIADDARMRAEDEIAGCPTVMLGEVTTL